MRVSPSSLAAIRNYIVARDVNRKTKIDHKGQGGQFWNKTGRRPALSLIQRVAASGRESIGVTQRTSKIVAAIGRLVEAHIDFLKLELLRQRPARGFEIRREFFSF